MFKSKMKSAKSTADLQQFPGRVLDCLVRMFDQQDSCDVTFLVRGPGDSAQTKIMAHRLILCSCSPLLHKNLQWGKKSGPKKQQERDIPADVFRDILRFMYSDSIPLTPQKLSLVMKGATKYQLGGLRQRCVDYVKQSLTDTSVCAVLDQCLADGEESLVAVCLCYIENYSEAVLQNPGFPEATPAALKRILGMGALNASEVTVFKACVAWASRRVAAGGSATVQGPALRAHLEPFMSLFRFPTMTTEEFATHVVPLNILTDLETCNIFKSIACPQRPEKWFETKPRMRTLPKLPEHRAADGKKAAASPEGAAAKNECPMYANVYLVQQPARPQSLPPKQQQQQPGNNAYAPEPTTAQRKVDVQVVVADRSPPPPQLPARISPKTLPKPQPRVQPRADANQNEYTYVP